MPNRKPDPTYYACQPFGLPQWLAGPNGILLHEIWGTLKDGAARAADEAIEHRLFSLASDDALRLAMADRALEDAGNAATNREVLSSSWARYALSGTRLGLLVALDAMGYPNVTVTERVDHWFDFRVDIGPPLPWPGELVSSLARGPSSVSYTTGLLEPYRTALIKTIQRWSPANTTLVELRVRIPRATSSSSVRYRNHQFYGERVISLGS